MCYLSLTHHFESVSVVACRLRWDAAQHMLEKLAPGPVHTGTGTFAAGVMLWRDDAASGPCGALRGSAPGSQSVNNNVII